MFDTHHQWLNVALKQNDELYCGRARLGAQAGRTVRSLPGPEPRPVQQEQDMMVGRTHHRKCATPGEYEMQLPVVALFDHSALVHWLAGCGVVVCDADSRVVRHSRLYPPSSSG